eukprot:SRR837773.11758.p1 GENE.SRR837773.11758~~SRR837773.11758.p1  ORF type:complete len:186 (-),score=34.03 SRR837773.11758:72-629(-)
MYMADGFLISNDGGSVFMYVSEQPFTHGGSRAKPTWGRNTGIRLLHSRLDGFTFVQAPYLFKRPVSELPSLTTFPLLPPSNCTQGVVLRLNFQASAAGFLAAEVKDSIGLVLSGYELGNSDVLRGSSLGAVVTWNEGKNMTLPPDVKGAVQIKVAFTAAKLYSLRLACFTPPQTLELHEPGTLFA